MGKSKIKIQKIEKDSNRRVTFNKRKIGLLKKAYEISILCEVDIALIFFAQTGEMTCFEGPRSSIEEVVMKFASTSENDRTKSHMQKYTTLEDQARNTMPRKIENEEVFQEVATELYHSSPRAQTPSRYDRSHEMELCHHSLLQNMMRQIRNIQHLLSVYDLNTSINELIFSNKDSIFMESYIQRQLQRIEESKKELPQLAPSLAEPWTDGTNNDRQSQLVESTYANQELATTSGVDNNIEQTLESQVVESTYANQELATTSSLDNNIEQILIGWDAIPTKLGILYHDTSADKAEPTIVSQLSAESSIDEVEPPIGSQFLESTFEGFPLSIENDIDTHDFFDSHVDEPLEEVWEKQIS